MAKLPDLITLPGYSVQPAAALESGQILFTDGTNTMFPNQQQCEAYGYKYDKVTGTCSAFTPTMSIPESVKKQHNNIQGNGNSVETGTSNSYIMGESNTIKGLSRNNIVGGSKHEIQNSINNAALFGINADATRQSQFAIGGGDNRITTSGTSVFGDRQVSIVNLSCVTTDNTTTNMTVNNLGTDYINVKNNCILGWEIYITRLEVAGSSATRGNFSYRNQKGVVRINDSYSMTFTVGFDRNIGKLGVNGTYAMADVSTSDVKAITIQVGDRNNVTNIWSATVYLHELISTNVTF
jgi:hypothetical protein